MKSLEDVKPILEKARTQLKIASSLIYENASGVQPFKLSKFMNVIAKEASQLHLEICCLLRLVSSEFDKKNFFNSKMFSLQILEAYFEELKEARMLRAEGEEGVESFGKQ